MTRKKIDRPRNGPRVPFDAIRGSAVGDARWGQAVREYLVRLVFSIADGGDNRLALLCAMAGKNRSRIVRIVAFDKAQLREEALI